MKHAPVHAIDGPHFYRHCRARAVMLRQGQAGLIEGHTSAMHQFAADGKIAVFNHHAHERHLDESARSLAIS